MQVPWDCFPVPDCINGGNQTYLYAHHGGLVKVLPSMMPNEDSWIKESVRCFVSLVQRVEIRVDAWFWC